MPAGAEPQFRTNKRPSTNVGKAPGTGWSSNGKFEFSCWVSLYADDAATALDSRDTLLAATSAAKSHLKKPGLLIQIGVLGGKHCPTGRRARQRQHLGPRTGLRRSRQLNQLV